MIVHGCALSFITTCAIIEHSIQLFKFPTEGTDGRDASVIPNSIPSDSFTDPLGEADDFTINWQPVNINYDHVFYRIEYTCTCQEISIARVGLNVDFAL